MDDGSIQLCSRTIACIYYLTKDWQAEYGGELVDLEAHGGPKVHVPQYNSVVMFRVPRWHEVRPVIGDRPRYSVFGWFLEPGKLYDLNVSPHEQQQQQTQQRDAGQQDMQQAAARSKRKETRPGKAEQMQLKAKKQVRKQKTKSSSKTPKGKKEKAVQIAPTAAN
eukprot:GHRR01032441.1.p1 GENE.GHRR01032441.1~~GHRR01032441.1.p1  ORF type:complete len:181 (+),score=69.31 GHRR01032441.1:51-545(+)